MRSVTTARGCIACLALCATLSLRSAHAFLSGDPVLDATLETRHDDNLPFAVAPADVESDTALAARAAGGLYFQLSDSIGLTTTVDLRGEHYFEFEGLDHVAAGLSAALRGKLGLGAEAPWWRLSAGFSAVDYDFDPRDGLEYRAGVRAGRRLGERLAVEIGYDFERRRAHAVRDIPFVVTVFGLGGAAFDGDVHAFSFVATYDWSERLALQAGYARRMGDVCATTRIDPEILEYSTAVTPDPVFGFDRYAYRLDVDTDVFTARMSYALSDHLALSASYERRDAHSSGSIAYSSNVGGLALLYRY